MVRVGTDPELFLKDTRHGGVVPVCGLLGGKKDAPLAITKLGSGYAVQEDNVMAEFNIPPTNDPEEFSWSVGRMIGEVRDLVRTRVPHLDIDYGSARLFPYAALESPQARLFGCSPDYNAHASGEPYRRVNPRELETPDGAWRFAGGHIHISYEADIPPHVVAQFCDVFLGLPSVGLDKQGERRSLYGQAGRFRPTSYGIEYRTLSNFWIFDSVLCQDLASRALDVGLMVEQQVRRLQPLYHEIPWIDVQAAINTENETLAADLLAYARNDLGLEEAA